MQYIYVHIYIYLNLLFIIININWCLDPKRVVIIMLWLSFSEAVLEYYKVAQLELKLLAILYVVLVLRRNPQLSSSYRKKIIHVFWTIHN